MYSYFENVTPPNQRFPSDLIVWVLAFATAVFAVGMILLTGGCASAPLKAGMPHTIQTNRFLSNDEIRLKGSEERIIVGHAWKVGAAKRID